MAAANVNNNGQAMGFTFEPTYSGASDKKCTAELFIQAVEAHRAAAGLNDTQTVAYAMKYLRGDALSYFQDYYPSVDPENARRIVNDWPAWLAVFKRAYFTIGAATHVTTGWAKLKQLPGETVQEFANRTASHLKSYTTYLPNLPATTIPENYRTSDADVTIAHNEFTAAIAANAAPTMAEIRVWLDPMMRRGAVEACNIGSAAQKVINQQCMLLKVVINGLTDPQAREMATRMEVDRKSLHDIVTALRDRERTKSNSYAIENKPVRMLARPTITVADMHDGEDDGANVSAIGRGRGGGSRGGGSSKRNSNTRQSNATSNQSRQLSQSGNQQQHQTSAGSQQQQQPRAYDDDHERGAVCGYCHLRNHRADQCRRKKMGIPPPKPKQSAIYDNEDSGVFLQGNGEMA